MYIYCLSPKHKSVFNSTVIQLIVLPKIFFVNLQLLNVIIVIIIVTKVIIYIFTFIIIKVVIKVNILLSIIIIILITIIIDVIITTSFYLLLTLKS